MEIDVWKNVQSVEASSYETSAHVRAKRYMNMQPPENARSVKVFLMIPSSILVRICLSTKSIELFKKLLVQIFASL